MKQYLILLSAVGFLFAGRPAPACTGLVVQDGERVLVGNNEDRFNHHTGELDYLQHIPYSLRFD